MCIRDRVNLIMPLPQLLATIGFMLGTGGSAIVGITLGEGDQKKADRYFTMFLLAAAISEMCIRDRARPVFRPPVTSYRLQPAAAQIRAMTPSHTMAP